MHHQAGIWIDREHATVVLIDQEDVYVRSFAKGDAEPFPETRESRKAHDYTRNDFIAEDKRERKATNDRYHMYDAVMAFTKDADAIYLMGPGEAKLEFQQRLMEKRHGTLNITLETADKLSEGQLKAKVRLYFDSCHAIRAKAKEEGNGN